MNTLDSDGLIIELNYTNDLVDERLSDERFNSRKMFDLLPESIVDKRTLEVIEVHDLFKAIDCTLTSVGSARLFHSLVNPSESIELVHAKQDAFCELQNNQPLRQGISTFLSEFATREKDLFKYLNAHMHPMLAYGDYKRAMSAINEMLATVKKLPQPETVYIDSLFKSILSFESSPTRGLVGGSVLRTLRGVISKCEKKSFFSPSWKFSPRRLGFGALLPSLPGVYFGLAWLFGFLHPGFAKAMFLLTSWMSVVGVLYAALLKPMADYETAILPVRKRLLSSNRFASAIEGVAAIDELMSFVQYSEEMPHPTVIPEVTNESSHFFVARNLRNPIQCPNDENFVANDVELTSARMSFITGPNSGGKTTYCKSIVQNQILAQIGSPVVASAAMINMADIITYQAPSFDTLLDPEGRFGTELKVTRDIFYSVSPKSLAILDEIAEGTTTEEKMTFSVDIMKGFFAIGNNTMLVTHSHELVEKFMQEGKGEYLQVDFKDGMPTHKMVKGVSKDSHALRVAQKINFSPEDMQRHLKEKGYL